MKRRGTKRRGTGNREQGTVGKTGVKASSHQGISVRWSIVCGLLFLFSGFWSPSFAHQNSMGYAQFKISQDSVAMNLKILPHDINAISRIDKNGDMKYSKDEIKSAEAITFFYVQNKLKVFSDGKACSFSPGALYYAESQKYVQLEAQYKCEKGKKILVQSSLFMEEDPGFRLVGRMEIKGREEEWVFQKGKPDWEVFASGGTSLLRQLAQFVHLGIEHIFLGYDHIMFLFGLLLLGGSFRNLLKIVTSFTIAHSMTLILATLKIITLPVRFTESAIALSIMYIAVENFFIEDTDKRWRITFFFGLVHGFGFSSVLREMGLPERGLILSLLSFNAGVEIGQACIVSVLFPVVLYVSRFQWSPKFVRIASCIILAFGTVWFFQRAFNINLIPPSVFAGFPR